LASCHDQRPWHFGWRELTDGLTVGRQRRPGRPSGQEFFALADRRAAVVLSAAHMSRVLLLCCCANLRMSFRALHRAHVWPLHLNG